MDQNKKKAGNPAGRRNLKYGSLSVVITALVIVLALALNTGFTALGSVFGWYTDMTAEGIYSLSDTFREKMEGLLTKNGKPVYVNLVLMTEEDYFRGMNSFTAMIYETLKAFEAAFPTVKLVCYNTTIHPELAEKYKRTALDTPSLSDVVIELADENHNALENIPAKKYIATSFFTTNTDDNTVVAYNAEARLLSAVAQLTGQAEKPTAFYLQGHGEPTLAEAPEWTEVLALAGFEVKELNLLNEDFPASEGSDHNNDIVIVNAPKYDLISTVGFSEVKKIRAFLGTDYGNMIVVEDASVPKLPALEGLLSEWGIALGSSVTDDAHSAASSGASTVFADYSQTYKPSANTPATQILKKLYGGVDSKRFPTLIFGTPKEIVILDDSQIPKGMNGSATSFSLITSYDTARTKNASGEVEVRPASLFGVAKMVWELNLKKESFMAVLGASDFLSGEYEKSGVNANRDVMFGVINLMWDGVTTFEGIDRKFFDVSTLTVSASAANTWTIMTVAVLPVLVAGLGVYVYIRRRHS